MSNHNPRNWVVRVGQPELSLEENRLVALCLKTDPLESHAAKHLKTILS